MEEEEEEEEEADEEKEENENEDQDIENQTQLQEQDPEDSDSDEEDQPLALKNSSKPQAQPSLVPPRHGGKKPAGHMTVAGTAPASQTGHLLTHNEAIGQTGKSKSTHGELKEDQLQRLATGVTVDTEGETVQVMMSLFIQRLLLTLI